MATVSVVKGPRDGCRCAARGQLSAGDDEGSRKRQ
jgi:hypothetical protein